MQKVKTTWTVYDTGRLSMGKELAYMGFFTSRRAMNSWLKKAKGLFEGEPLIKESPNRMGFSSMYLDEDGYWVILVNEHHKFGGKYWSTLTGCLDAGEAKMVVDAINAYKAAKHSDESNPWAF